MKKKSANMVIKEEEDDDKSHVKLAKGLHSDESEEQRMQKVKQKNFRSARLIVRNVSFKSKENLIKEHFSKFGEVLEVNLLKKGTQLVGCCFIQFKEKSSAAKAIAQLSGKPFLGRPIVVDWALPKAVFTNKIKKELGSKEETPTVKEEPNDSSSGEDEEGESHKSKDDNSASDASEDEDEESNGGSEKSEDSDGDEDSENNDDSESDGESDISTEENKNQSGKKTFPSQDKNKNKKFHFQYDPNDVSDGRTVFLKNVPFSANDDDLLKCAEEVGTVVYAVICMDPLTEHSKGTAFVKFNDKSVVSDIISGKTKLVLKGVKLEAHLALKKNQVQKSDTKCPKDNRNLYLLREGVILAGSQAAEGVSESDMAKRLQLEHWKTLTLKNLNKFVSTNRLVVHNIPPFYTDEMLRKLFKDHSPKGADIREARIIRNLKDLDEKGVGKSKGYGFVAYSRHEHALVALRVINNNPAIFTENNRPIVGFSIENKAALRLKEIRKIRSQNPKPKSPFGKEIETSSNTPGNKKRKYNQIEENTAEYCGYTAKPGAKKMRSGKELKVQAALHHKAIIDKKRAERRLRFTGKHNNRKNIKKKRPAFSKKK